MYIRSFTKIMDDATDIIHEHKGDMMLANFVRGIVMTGFICVLAIIMAIIIAIASVVSGGILGICGAIVAAVLIIAIIHAGSGSIMLLTDNVYHKRFMTVTMAIGGGLKRLPALAGYAAFEILGLVPLMIVGAIIIWIVGGGVKSMIDLEYFIHSPAGSVGMLFVIYTLLITSVCILLACYQTFFIFGTAAIVVDGLGPLQALKKNWRLIKGEFKESMGRVILTWLGIGGVNLCFNMILVLIAMVIALICAIAGLEFSESMIQVMVAIIEWPANIIFSLLFLAIQPAVVTVFYYNQKCKKEGTDLLERLKMMSKLKETPKEESTIVDLIKEDQVVAIKEVKENGDGIDDRIRGGI